MKLAEEADMHINAIGNIERGIQIPSLETILLLGRALGVPAATLVDEVEKRNPRLSKGLAATLTRPAHGRDKENSKRKAR